MAVEIEKYIKELSPELREKVRECKGMDELMKFAKTNKVPLPDEALEAVSGGRIKPDGSVWWRYSCNTCKFNTLISEAERTQIVFKNACPFNNCGSSDFTISDF